LLLLALVSWRTDREGAVKAARSVEYRSFNSRGSVMEKVG
jgi:hypothetical protein